MSASTRWPGSRVPLMHAIFGTEALTLAQLAIVAPFPFIVWGADEIRRWLLRRHRRARQAESARAKGPAAA
jgi:hypothetical protein